MKTPFILTEVGKVLNTELRNILKAKGHFNTGQLEGSIKSTITNDNLSGEMFDYGHIVDDGTPAARIPFRPGSGAKSSKYIDALIIYFRGKGLNEKEAKSAAFATAKTQLKEGMSTRNSVRYSTTGNRNNFVADAWGKAEPAIDKMIDRSMDDVFNEEFERQKNETI